MFAHHVRDGLLPNLFPEGERSIGELATPFAMTFAVAQRARRRFALPASAESIPTP